MGPMGCGFFFALAPSQNGVVDSQLSHVSPVVWSLEIRRDDERG